MTTQISARVATLTAPFDLVAGLGRRWLVGWAGLLALVTALNFCFPHLVSEAQMLSWLGIVACLVYIISSRTTDHWLTAAASLTIAADFCLILRGWIAPGVALFCLVQVVHALRLRRFARTSPWPYLATLGTMALIGYFMHFDATYLLASLYACGLAHNFLTAQKYYRTTRYALHSARIFWGFVAFIACDACVALSYLISAGIVDPLIPALVFANLSYLFYLPSQILLAISAQKRLTTNS
jgi:hypothetical protein